VGAFSADVSYVEFSIADLAVKANYSPDRLVKCSSIQSDYHVDFLEEWATSVELRLDPLTTSLEARHKVLSLLYHYRHINGTILTDLPCTNLITQCVRI